jgi:hypothetical protein
MLKMIIENHSKGILTIILHGKINAGKPIKKYTVLTEGNTTVPAQILKDLDDDGVYLATASYTMEHYRKCYEDMN